MEKSLVDDLKYWRCERPDEWKMDEFIRKAERLQSLTPELLELLKDAHTLMQKSGAFVENAPIFRKIEAAIAKAEPR